jgi:hypothetical protein
MPRWLWAIRELLDRLRQVAADVPPDVDVDAVGGDVEIWLRDAEIVGMACAGRDECYGDAAVRLAPDETIAVALRLIETALRAMEGRETATTAGT